MSPFYSELTGTAVLIILGDGVVANVILDKTKGNNGGLISITLGWGIAVFVAVYVATAAGGGANLSPAVSIALACLGKLSWAELPTYIIAQMLGAMLGAFVVWLAYKQHFDATQDKATKLGVFCTGPSIRSAPHNFITEFIGTFVLIFGILFITKSTNTLGSLDALPVALLVLAVGLSLGGPTGYAINPARDLGPRIMHAILPIKGKGNSDWAYSWVPIAGPMLGAIAAAYVYKLIM